MGCVVSVEAAKPGSPRRRRDSRRYCEDCGRRHPIEPGEEFRSCVTPEERRNKDLWDKFTPDLGLLLTLAEVLNARALLTDDLWELVFAYVATNEGVLFSHLVTRMEKCVKFGARTRRDSDFSELRARGARSCTPSGASVLSKQLWGSEARRSFCIRTYYDLPELVYDPKSSPPYLLFNEKFYVFPGPLGWYKLQCDGFLQVFVYASLEELIENLNEVEGEVIGLSESGSWHPIAETSSKIGIPKEMQRRDS